MEDYEDAATLKVAIATVATKDTVGTAISHLKVPVFTPLLFLLSLCIPFDLLVVTSLVSSKVLLCVSLTFQRAIEEERYSDAAFLRDEAGTGLVSFHWDLVRSLPLPIIIYFDITFTYVLPLAGGLVGWNVKRH